MNAASAITAPTAPEPADPHVRLVERVNRLYHEQTAVRFDADHRARHRVEAPFWQWVVRTLLEPAPSGAGHRAIAATTSQKPVRKAGRTLLDIACGSGFVVEQLLPWLAPADRIIGVDLSTASLCTASKKPGLRDARVCWLAASGMRLPLAGESVELVTLNASLHHFARPELLLHEIDRVLAPGGHVAIGFEPNARYFESQVLHHIGSCLDRLAWYLSPVQNLRRCRSMLPRRGRANPSDTPDAANDEHLAAHIAQQLRREQLSREALPPAAVLDLVDPHARRSSGRAGLHLHALVAAALPGYRVVRYGTSDYLGASVRRCRILRAAADTMGRWIDASAGSLFCCLLEKGAAS